MDSIHFFLGKNDQTIIIFYFILIAFLGFITKKEATSEKFILGDRQLTLFAFVGTLVATWYGGVLGIGEFCYRYGLSSWLIMGVPYYISAGLFAVFLSKKVRSSSFLTIPDRLRNHYGDKVALLASIVLFFHTMPASKVLILGLMLKTFLGIPLSYAIILGTLFSVIYIFTGGFVAVVRTDVLQFLLMIVSFIIILPFSMHYAKIHGLNISELPENFISWRGEASLSYISVWFIFALWTLIAPSFHQRCAAVKDPGTVKKGIVIAIVIWIFMDGMMTLTGIYTRLIFPNINPLYGYMYLANATLPSLFKGLFLIGILSFVMSTIDSHFHIIATTFGYDIVNNIAPKYFKAHQQKIFIIGLLLSAAGAIFIAVVVPSVITIWYTIYTVTLPILFLPVLTTYFPKYKISPRATFTSMLVSGVGVVLWVAIGFYRGSVRNPDYLLSLEPVYLGFLISIFFSCINNNDMRH